MQAARNTVINLLTNSNYSEALGTALANMGFVKKDGGDTSKKEQQQQHKYCQYCKKRVAHSEAACYKNPDNKKGKEKK